MHDADITWCCQCGNAKGKKIQAKKIIREEYRIHLFHSIPDVPNDLKLVGEREREEERLRE